MSQKKPFKIGALVHCECPEGDCKLPIGLPRNAIMEVVGTQADTTRVLYYGKIYTLPAACAHSQIKDCGPPQKQNGKAKSVSPRELTPRQRQILVLVAEGHSTKEIAFSLGVSVKTVETHSALLKERLDIHNVAGLVRYALRLGLISA